MPAAGASASGTKLAPLAKAFGWAGAVGVDPPDDATERGDVGLRGGVGAPFGATVCGSVGTPGATAGAIESVALRHSPVSSSGTVPRAQHPRH